MSTFKVKNGVLEIRNIDTPDIEKASTGHVYKQNL